MGRSMDRLYSIKRRFEHHFSHIAPTSAPVYAFLEFLSLVFHKIFSFTQWPLSRINIVGAWSAVTEINPVAMTHLSSERDWPSHRSN